MKSPVIRAVEVHDVRFPTSDALDGSDAVHVDPDYSVAYVVLRTGVDGLEGHGSTFTLGRGNELCCAAARSLAQMLVGTSVAELERDMLGVYRRLTRDSQMRWVGPEKGVVHLAAAAVINAVWDLIAVDAGLPLWRYLCELPAERLVAALDFTYVSDVLTPTDALEMLRAERGAKRERIDRLEKEGYPAYTTSCGWLGYSDERIEGLCKDALDAGWNHFKVKVGRSPEDDERRCALVRDLIGPDRSLMIDANQRWDVDEAIANVRALARHDIRWIEEPTSPDDVLGHARIAREVAPIKVATGEQCQNRVVFKQLMQSGGVHYVQADACRLGGVNEFLTVLLLARRYGLPVCPHAGGVGLCEYVNHMVSFDFVALTGTTDDRMCEYVSHLDEHVENLAVVERGRYRAPSWNGYGARLRPQSVAEHAFPHGPLWSRRLAASAS
ncbi:MAG: enolase C-terminal domain-like protein [Planctomycetota bacterium]